MSLTQEVVSNHNKLIMIVERFIKTLNNYFQETKHDESKVVVHTDTVEIPSSLLYLVSSLPEQNGGGTVVSGIKNNSFSSLLSLSSAASNKSIICGKVDVFDENSLFSSVGKKYRNYRKKISVELPELKKRVSGEENNSSEEYEEDKWEFTVYFILVPVSPSLFILRVISPKAYSKLCINFDEKFPDFTEELLLDKLRSGNGDKKNIYFDDIKNQFEKLGKLLLSSSEVEGLLNINPGSSDLFKAFINAFEEEGEQEIKQPSNKPAEETKPTVKEEEKLTVKEEEKLDLKNKLGNRYEDLYLKDARSYHLHLMKPFSRAIFHDEKQEKESKKKKVFPYNMPLQYTQLESAEFTEESKTVGMNM
jgi:hypothetical protein